MATQINAGDSAATARGKIVDVLALGLINSSGITSWGAARAKLNELAVLFGRDQIGDKEIAASVREKIEAMILGPTWVNGARLVLDFANNRAWRDGLTSLAGVLTIMRASGGSYFDAQGVLRMAANDALRFDHDPDTKAALGVLIEPQRANLFSYSADFTQAAWTKTRATITPNATLAPDGTTTAALLIEDTTATATHQLSRASAVNAAGVASSPSIYIKKAPGGRRYVQIWTGNFANQSQRSQITFDLDTGTGVVTGSPVGTAAVNIQKLANGWWRLSPYTVSNGVGAVALTVSLMSNATTTTYTGDGVSGVYVWGGQWEDGSFPTSYIPTTTATATRAADVLKVPTGAWWNAGAGTLRMDGVVTTPILASGALDVSAMALAAGKSRVKTVEFRPS